MQNTSHLLMIEPVNFGFNAATAVNNSFQKNIGGDLQQKALEEFNDFVDLLRNNKVDITVVKDQSEPHTPDSIFPNNWISFHDNGTVFLYPMFAINRRLERKETVIDAVKEKFNIAAIHDLSHYETKQLYLEGTGSMVLDRVSRIAYACISPRTNTAVLNEFCRMNEYTAVSFIAKGSDGVDIYHTNVMMCIAEQFAVVCLASITDTSEKEKLIASLQSNGKEIIDISLDQLDHFAGNMLQVLNSNNERLLVMSSQAYASLSEEQVNRLEKYNRILHSSLDNIETAGGGSARCMLAEVFLQPKA